MAVLTCRQSPVTEELGCSGPQPPAEQHALLAFHRAGLTKDRAGAEGGGCRPLPHSAALPSHRPSPNRLLVPSLPFKTSLLALQVQSRDDVARVRNGGARCAVLSSVTGSLTAPHARHLPSSLSPAASFPAFTVLSRAQQPGHRSLVLPFCSHVFCSSAICACSGLQNRAQSFQGSPTSVPKASANPTSQHQPPYCHLPKHQPHGITHHCRSAACAHHPVPLTSRPPSSRDSPLPPPQLTLGPVISLTVSERSAQTFPEACFC